MTEEEAKEFKCKCGLFGIITDANPPHYKKLSCSSLCGESKHLAWIKKPESNNRRASSKNLIKKYSKGFCELCLVDEITLKSKGRYLEAHHVIEYKDGGTDERDNIQLVCNLCHTEIHNRRALVS